MGDTSVDLMKDTRRFFAQVIFIVFILNFTSLSVTQ